MRKYYFTDKWFLVFLLLFLPILGEADDGVLDMRTEIILGVNDDMINSLKQIIASDSFKAQFPNLSVTIQPTNIAPYNQHLPVTNLNTDTIAPLYKPKDLQIIDNSFYTTLLDTGGMKEESWLKSDALNENFELPGYEGSSMQIKPLTGSASAMNWISKAAGTFKGVLPVVSSQAGGQYILFSDESDKVKISNEIALFLQQDKTAQLMLSKKTGELPLTSGLDTVPEIKKIVEGLGGTKAFAVYQEIYKHIPVQQIESLDSFSQQLFERTLKGIGIDSLPTDAVGGVINNLKFKIEKDLTLSGSSKKFAFAELENELANRIFTNEDEITTMGFSIPSDYELVTTFPDPFLKTIDSLTLYKLLSEKNRSCYFELDQQLNDFLKNDSVAAMNFLEIHNLNPYTRNKGNTSYIIAGDDRIFITDLKLPRMTTSHSDTLMSAPDTPIPTNPNIIFYQDTDGNMTQAQQEFVERIHRYTTGIVAIFAKEDLIPNQSDGSYTPVLTVTELCPGERFYGELKGPKATGFRVGNDLIATAGHVIEDTHELVFVFNYKGEKKDEKISAVDVYFYKKDKSVYSKNADYAIVQVSRPIDAKQYIFPISAGNLDKDQQIYMLGYPDGLRLTLTDNARILTLVDNKFETSLDTFKGNSGSPVFDQESSLVIGVMNDRTGNDFRFRYMDIVLKIKCNTPIAVEYTERGTACTKSKLLLKAINSF